MGNPKSAVLGVDPEAESSLRRKMRLALMVLIYKAKIVLCALVLKVIFIMCCSTPTQTWLKSFAALISSCLWDTLVTAVIMERVQVCQPATGLPPPLCSRADGY
jgi:hypothetical protein